MKLRWLVPLVLFLPFKSYALDDQHGRVTTLTIQPGAITPVHLRPEFESVIHLPEEVTSIVVGSPGSFHVEHDEAEPTFVYVKPSMHTPAQSDLLIAMKSGQHIVLELISDGDSAPAAAAVDFLLEYKPYKSLVVFAGTPTSDLRVNSINAAKPTPGDYGDAAPQLNLTPGTRIQARLETQVSSATTAPVVAVVEYTYSLGDHVVIPAGAKVYGQLQQADRSGAVSIKFTEMELLDGNRFKIEATATSLELGPIKGAVSGKNTGRNFLVRTASGIGSVAAMLVGNNTSGAFSEDDMIRERIAQNIGNAGDTQIMNMALTNHIVVSVPADTPIYIVFTKSEVPTATSHTNQ